MCLEVLLLLMVDEAARKRLAMIVAKAQAERSQRQFAKDLGVSQGTVQNWLSGTGFPSSENLEKIATAAGMSLEELYSQVKGEASPTTSPKVAEDVLQLASQLDKKQIKRLIMLLVKKL